MNREQLEHMEDVTRRYGKYRPCGAGLGVLWGGLILGTLGALTLRWMRSDYLARAAVAQTFWRFLRDTQLIPPGWLQLAALVSPFLGWLGLMVIQHSVDRRSEEHTSELQSPMYLIAATDSEGHFASGNLIIFGTYFALMMWLLLQGGTRFSRFLKVRADLSAMQPVDE